MSSPIVLILGAGPNIGAGLSKAFGEEDYKVAITSRSAKAWEGTTLAISADHNKPETIHAVFEEVRQKLGEPTVVIYNAAAATLPPNDDPLALTVATFEQTLTINTTSAYAALKEAVETFKGNGNKGIFIYTGNILNKFAMPMYADLGAGKCAMAHWVEVAAKAYAGKNMQFYYADERKSDGMPIGNDVSGEAAGEMYVELAKRQEQGDWLATFVQGKGYVKF